MRILDITSRLPWPLVDGARIVMYQLIDGLVRNGHDVSVVAIEEEDCDCGPLAEMVDLHTVRIRPAPRIVGALTTLFASRPYTQIKRDRPEVYALLDRLQSEHPYNLVIADQAHVAAYGAYMKKRYGVPYLLRCHNVEHEIWRRQLPTISNPVVRRYVLQQTGRWERFERCAFATADACIAITDRDRDIIAGIAPGNSVRTIPAAVDLSSFPYVDPDHREGNSVILLGNMGWPPNRNAVLWFMREIYPLIMREAPDLVCHLVGDNPPLNDLPLPDDRFKIHGRVESIAPFYGSIAVGLIPLNIGGGMRVKMVEMMSSGMPIVATRQGAEGNLAIPGEHYLQASTPDDFARCVVRLLRNTDERRRLARAAREFVALRYSLESTTLAIEETIVDLAGIRSGA